MKERGSWSYEIVQEGEGTLRLMVTDEDQVPYPVARRLTRDQAELLMRCIEREHEQSRRRIAQVIRDPKFMASSVLLIKRTKLPS